jgi:hypothetical protein
LRFSLFGDRTMKIRPQVAEMFQGSLDKRKLFGERPAPTAPKETR